MASIKFDTTEILSAAYLPQYMKHETVTERLLTQLPLARQDGSILIADRRGVKMIYLKGTLIAASQSALDTAIDAFNELFSRPQKNLDITWEGGTRRFVATCTSHEYDRDHFNINAVGWTAEFTVLSGEGKDTSSTASVTNFPVTTNNPNTDFFNMVGSKPGKPYIIIQGQSFAANTCGIEYKNTDTGEKIVINKQSELATTDYMIIDCSARKAYYSPDNVTLTEMPFYGVFPSWIVGRNNVQISCGSLFNQTTLNAVAGGISGSTYSILATTVRLAQSLSVPYTDGTFRSIDLELARLGTPGDITVRIETDSNGSPSGTLADANATLSASYTTLGIGTSAAVITFNFPARFILNANTKYWIVIKSAATSDGSNHYILYPGSNYSRGSMKNSSDSGVTYGVYVATPASFAFALKYGGLKGTSGILHSVSYTKTYL